MSRCTTTTLLKIKIRKVNPRAVIKSKPRGLYRRYTSKKIEKLIDLVIEEGKTAKKAALITGNNVRTAQHYIKKYNDDEERCLPGGCSNPRSETWES
jgi:hypothetical protein